MWSLDHAHGPSSCSRKRLSGEQREKPGRSQAVRAADDTATVRVAEAATTAAVDRAQPRAAVVDPWLSAGGARAVAAWALAALPRDYDVSLITLDEEASAETLNARFGTALTDASFRVARPDWPLPKRLQRARTLSHHRISRFVRARIDSYDVALSTSNEMDLGGGQMQYIHFPSVLKLSAHARALSSDRLNRLRHAYRSISARATGFAYRRVESNETLTNSRWTASVLCTELGISARVVYPPVWSELPLSAVG